MSRIPWESHVTASMSPFIEGGLQRARYIACDIWNHGYIHYLLVKNLQNFSSYSYVKLFWHLIVNQRECMTRGISYGTLMSQSQEIGENSCLTIWKMASRNSKQQMEDMCGDVCYSCRFNWKLIRYIIYLLNSAIRVVNII